MLRVLDVIRLRIRSLFRRARVDTDLDRELRAHIGQQVEEYVDRGMSRDEATRVAVSTFGGIERVREESRDARAPLSSRISCATCDTPSAA